MLQAYVMQLCHFWNEVEYDDARRMYANYMAPSRTIFNAFLLLSTHLPV